MHFVVNFWICPSIYTDVPKSITNLWLAFLILPATQSLLCLIRLPYSSVLQSVFNLRPASRNLLVNLIWGVPSSAVLVRRGLCPNASSQLQAQFFANP